MKERDLITARILLILSMFSPVLSESVALAGGSGKSNKFVLVEDGSIKKVLKKILTKYHPDRHYFIGIGRSPSVIIEHMKQAKLRAVNLPLTGVSDRTEDLSPREAARFEAYLAKRFPDKTIFDHLTVVLIDFAESGNTAVVASRQIEKFLGRKVALAVFALDTNTEKIEDRLAQEKSLLSHLVCRISGSGNFGYWLSGRVYRQFSEFSAFEISKKDCRVASNPGYKHLEAAVRQNLDIARKILDELKIDVDRTNETKGTK